MAASSGMNFPHGIHRTTHKNVASKEATNSKILKLHEKITRDTETLKTLNCETEHDVKSRTGSNLREIMLLMRRTHISEIKIKYFNTISYFLIKKEDEWKLELLERGSHGLEEEAQEWLELLCTQ